MEEEKALEERKTLLQRIQWELQHMKETEHLFDVMRAEVESVDEETNTIVYRMEPLPWMQVSFGVVTAAAQMALMEVLLTLSSWAITGSNQWRGIDMQADCLRRAIRQKQLERQLEITLTPEITEALASEMDKLNSDGSDPG